MAEQLQEVKQPDTQQATAPVAATVPVVPVAPVDDDDDLS